MATKYYQEMVANDFDGKLFAVPIIESQSFPDSGQISGVFSRKGAADLAAELNSGPLPIELRLKPR